MSVKINIASEDLTLYGGNARTKHSPSFSTQTSGGVHWGSNWVYTEKETGSSTIYNVGKIRIKMPNKILPKGTKIQIQVTNNKSWCGAGYIKGYVSLEDLTLNQTVKWNSEGGTMKRQSALENSVIIKCSSNFGWGHGSEGEKPQWVGTLTKTLDLGDKDYLYIYMIDSVYNFGNPGSTTFSRSSLVVILDMPYTSVGDPGKVSDGISVSDDLSLDDYGSLQAYYDSTITFRFKVPAKGSNNDISGYSFWYKDYVSQEEKQFYPEYIDGGSNEGDIREYKYIGLEKIPEEIRTKKYDIGVKALATHENLDSSIVYLGSIKVINKAPEIPKWEDVQSNKISFYEEKTKTITIRSKSSKSFGRDIDQDGDSTEALTYFYTTIMASDELKNIDEITFDNLEGAIWQEGQVYKNGEIEFFSFSTSRKAPDLFIYAKDTSGAMSKIEYYPIPINTEPTITLEDLEFSGESLSFDGSKKYVHTVVSATPAVDDDRQFQYTIYGRMGSGQEYILNQGDNPEFNWEVATKTHNYGDEIFLRVSIDDIEGDNFEETFALKDGGIPYCKPPKLKTENLHLNFIVSPTGEGVASNKFLHHRDNSFEFNHPLENKDTTTSYTFFFSKTDGIKDNTLNQFSPSFEYNIEALNTPISSEPWSTQVDLERVKYYLKCTVKDGCGQVAHVLVKEYELLPLFDVSKGEFRFSKAIWEPLKPEGKDEETQEPIFNYELSFSALCEDNSGDTGINTYAIYASIDNGPQILLGEGLGANTKKDEFSAGKPEGSTIDFIIGNQDLFKKLRINTGEKTKKITFKIQGYNAHGKNETSKSCECQLVTRHSPYWVGSGEQCASAKVLIGSPYEGEIFNHGETIEFTFGRTLNNYNDIWWGWESGQFTTKSAKKITRCLVTVEGRTEQFSYDFEEPAKYPANFLWEKVPNFIENNEQEKAIVFQLQLVNDFQNEDGSIETLYSNITNNDKINLLACRKTNPSAMIKKVSYSEGDKNLQIDLSILDAGGKNNLSNFCRLGTEKTWLYVYGSTLGEPAENEKNLIPKNSGTSYSGNFNNLSFTEEQSLILPKNLTGIQKIWLKTKIVIETNGIKDNNLTTVTETYLLYIGAPTMSHRYHWVGINTNDNAAKEVFKVAQYDTQNLIVLTGIDENDATVDNIITINLSNGLLTGMRKYNGVEGTNYTINLATGEMSGYTINNGTFTGTFNGQYNGYINTSQIEGEINGGSW